MKGIDCALKFNHVAVQTADVEGSTRWYREFLGGTVEWSLDTFSELTHDRLPGINELVEVKVCDLRLHVFDRQGCPLSAPQDLEHRFQHVGAAVESAEQLRMLRERWFEVRDSGEFRWTSDEEPTEIVVDPDGMQSLYVVDPNGLEFEFIYFPDASE